MQTHAIAPLHVIVGAGQIGPLVAERLLARGLRVRLVRRGAFLGATGGAEVVSADTTNPAAAKEALRGASVVYHAANPAYHRWPAELVPLARGILAGTAAAGARLVALDNLYGYAVPADGVLRETTPVGPVSRKGALRAEAAELMLAAHRRGDVPVALVRASDFVGPRVTRSIFGERFWTKLFAGKPLETMGDPDQPHTYSYAPDTADALVTLALAAGVDGEIWHVPSLPAESTRVWMQRFAELAGRPLRTQNLGPFLMHVAGLFLPEAGELPEMMYQWRAPYVLDDTKFRTRFGAAPTPLAAVLRDTFAWASAEYARPLLKAS